MYNWAEQLSTLEPERRIWMERLQENLPESDLDCYPVSLFLDTVDHALMLRREAPWCAALDEETFFHYVLFPRVNDEDLTLYRALFYATLWSRVSRLDDTARVMEVNQWCHENAVYQCQDDRTASPLTVFRCGSGRCGEESTFLVAALRSVGMAARQVYAPRWSHCDDNHAWVEVLVDGVWHFLGACEPEPILNRGWFNTAASRAILIHSRTFGPGMSSIHGAPVGNEGNVYYYNQTTRYAKTRPYTFQATVDGKPADGASFSLQVLNESSYHTIAMLTADETGTATAELGIGDLHVTAFLDGRFAEGDCINGRILLSLGQLEDSGAWVAFDFHAPKDELVNPASLTDEEKARRIAVRTHGNQLRERRIAAFYLPEAATLPSATDLLQESRGNFETLHHFLSQDQNPLREMLLRSLSLKDLRDVTDYILEDHLRGTFPRPADLPEDIYINYLLCPRVANEKLESWRHTLTEYFSSQRQDDYRATPASLWTDLASLIRPAGDKGYENLYWPAKNALFAGHCNAKSLRVLYVALMRAMGVPARLRAIDGMPEYWQEGTFHPVVSTDTGTLHIVHRGDATPIYRQNWTLSQWNGSGWVLLNLGDHGWTGDRYSLSLPVGRYCLITSVRLPNGNQFAARQNFALDAGETVEHALRLRTFALEDLLGCQEMPKCSAQTLEGVFIPDVARQDATPRLLFWMEEGNEPTEHVLNELMAGQTALTTLPVGITVLLRGKDSLHQSTLAKMLRNWPEIQVLLDDWAFDLDAVARHLTCDPDRPPLAVAVNCHGQAVYGVSGYHVGSVELLTRIATRLCTE